MEPCHEWAREEDNMPKSIKNHNATAAAIGVFCLWSHDRQDPGDPTAEKEIPMPKYSI